MTPRLCCAVQVSVASFVSRDACAAPRSHSNLAQHRPGGEHRHLVLELVEEAWGGGEGW